MEVDKNEIWYQQIRIAMLMMKQACENLSNCTNCPCCSFCSQANPCDWDTEYYFTEA